MALTWRQDILTGKIYIPTGNETSGKGIKHPDREEYILTGNETSGKGTKHPDREEYILTGNETSGKGNQIS